ncbi:invasion associated locus B family protein [Labrys monachus]|uniref:Invasion protein IalB n=1 Tax=Labrys monachus TaxID=217067 RepID=A0ABU0FEB0_9HYPH|nr:invasion associated locus B family protein [Labrys monachus]MDQ0392944.1 invasion protein IalB [Labrys monachus]
MRNYLIAGLTAALMASGATSALAQDQPAAAPGAAQGTNQPPPPPFPQPDWTKVCAQLPSGKQGCQTLRDLRAPNGQPVLTVQLNQVKGDKPSLTVSVLPGMVLQVGARVRVDDQTLDTAKYKICYGTFCAAEMPLTDGNIAAMKKGKKLIVQVVSIQGQALAFPVSLDGFDKVFDGQGIDAQTYQANQQAYEKKLQDIFQAAEKAAGQQAPAAPSAPAAPAN